MRSASWLAVLASAALAAGCGRPTRTNAELPALPEILADDFDESVREEIEALASRLIQRPRDPAANGEAAMRMHAHRRYAEAARLYERARALAPQDYRWHYLGGVALEALGDAEAARQVLRRALELRPDEPAAMLAYARALAACGRQADGETFSLQALATLERSTELHPDYAPGWLALAETLLSDGREQAAAAAYELALERGPSHEAPHRALALLYERLGHQANADRHRSLAGQRAGVQAPPESRDLGALARTGALEADPAIRARALVEARFYRRAACDFERALELDPRDIESRADAIAVYGLLAQPADAARHYRLAQMLDPAASRPHLNMGLILLGQGRLGEAEAALGRALALDPRSLNAHLGLARLSLARGDSRQFENRARQAIALDPFHPLPRRELAAALLAQGRAAEAAVELETALAYSEGREAVELARQLAVAHRRAGRSAASAEALLRARALAERYRRYTDAASIDAEVARGRGEFPR